MSDILAKIKFELGVMTKNETLDAEMLYKILTILSQEFELLEKENESLRKLIADVKLVLYRAT